MSDEPDIDVQSLPDDPDVVYLVGVPDDLSPGSMEHIRETLTGQLDETTAVIVPGGAEQGIRWESVSVEEIERALDEMGGYDG